LASRERVPKQEGRVAQLAEQLTLNFLTPVFAISRYRAVNLSIYLPFRELRANFNAVSDHY